MPHATDEVPGDRLRVQIDQRAWAAASRDLGFSDMDTAIALMLITAVSTTEIAECFGLSMRGLDGPVPQPPEHILLARLEQH